MTTIANNNIRFDRSSRTITVTKRFYKKASIYGSAEYIELEEAMQSHPDYRIVVNQIKVSADRMKGLTIEKMEKHIKKHDDDKGSLMNTFKDLLDENENEDDFSEPASYGEIKQWFLLTFPEVKNNKVKEILDAAKAKAAA